MSLSSKSNGIILGFGTDMSRHSADPDPGPHCLPFQFASFGQIALWFGLCYSYAAKFLGIRTSR